MGTILYATRKGPMLNTLEKFCISHETANNNQLNDMNTVMTNAIFDAILRHCGDSASHI
jgi:hypothetical protein